MVSAEQRAHEYRSVHIVSEKSTYTGKKLEYGVPGRVPHFKFV